MSQFIDFTLPSTVPGRTLHGFRCVPEGQVRAVLQLSHGMVEFIDRYKPLAEYLAGQGIVVVGHDHLGHGGSIRTKADYGYFAEPDGNRAVLADLHAMTVLTKTLYPDVPYFLLGHSMGSFLLSSGAKGKRIALPNADIMIHQPSAGTQGKVTDMESDVEHFLKIKQRLNKILAENTGKTPEQIKSDSERDNWMTAEEAKEYGLIDKVIYQR